MKKGFFDTNYTRCLLLLVLMFAATRIAADVMCVFFDHASQRYQMIARAGFVEWQTGASILAWSALWPLSASTLVKFRTRTTRCFTKIAMAGLSLITILWLGRLYLAQDQVLQQADVQVAIDATVFLVVTLSLGALLNQHLMIACGVLQPKVNIDEPNSRPAPLMDDDTRQ